MVLSSFPVRSKLLFALQFYSALVNQNTNLKETFGNLNLQTFLKCILFILLHF